MNSNKHTKPILPTAPQVLEDLLNPDVIHCSKLKQAKGFPDNEVLDNAYKCYSTNELLKQDVEKLEELNESLLQLHAQLSDSLSSMHKSIKQNSH